VRQRSPESLAWEADGEVGLSAELAQTQRGTFPLTFPRNGVSWQGEGLQGDLA
jgi:hypothetical protein